MRMRTRIVWTRVHEEWEGLRHVALSLDPEDTFSGQADLIHRKRSSVVFKVRDVLPGRTGVTVWKWTFRRGRWRQFKDLFKGSRSTLEYDKGHELLRLGLPTPIPLGAVEARRCRRLIWSCLIMESVDFDGTVSSLWRQAHEGGGAVSWLPALGHHVWRAHDLGVCFRDMRPENLLVSWKSSSSFYFIDVGGLEKATPERRERSINQMFSLLRPKPTLEERAAFTSGYRGIS